VRLFALTSLVGLQGALGWWMVASGLEYRVDVSHFRLAAHLLTALFLLAGLVWTARDLDRLAGDPAARPVRLTGGGIAVIAILFIQLLLGAWVAGLNAGFVASSWPLMNDRFVPAGIDWSRGIGHALVNDPYLVHFVHRWWAWVAVAGLVVFARKLRPLDRRASILVHSAFGIQILLGIATVETGVHPLFAALHQAVGALLVAATAWGAHLLGRREQ
jgi:cytochrome c oxidase assembly protein subunit 15